MSTDSSVSPVAVCCEAFTTFGPGFGIGLRAYPSTFRLNGSNDLIFDGLVYRAFGGARVNTTLMDVLSRRPAASASIAEFHRRSARAEVFGAAGFTLRAGAFVGIIPAAFVSEFGQKRTAFVVWTSLLGAELVGYGLSAAAEHNLRAGMADLMRALRTYNASE
jgi:hypothetical protein